MGWQGGGPSIRQEGCRAVGVWGVGRVGGCREVGGLGVGRWVDRWVGGIPLVELKITILRK